MRQMKRPITFRMADRAKDGGCTACNARTGPVGEVTLGRMKIRLCPDCAKEILPSLQTLAADNTLPFRVDGWEVERGACFNALYRKGVYPNDTKEYPLFYMSVNRYSGKVSLYRRRTGMAATEIEVTDDPTMLKAAAKWANTYIATLAE